MTPLCTHMQGNSVSPSRHLTHLSLRRATPTKPHRSKDAFWTESAPRVVLAVGGPTTVYNILGYCTELPVIHWSQELGDIEIRVALCMSVGAGRGNFPDPPRTTSSNGVPAAERRQRSQG